mmetsp:Transcript_2538/g.5122  ORF Transcript_2538/g.5122 Transcript_2538/m.5122 type:complete len:273 (+) Transcript_2538:1471-2289(+)
MRRDRKVVRLLHMDRYLFSGRVEHLDPRWLKLRKPDKKVNCVLHPHRALNHACEASQLDLIQLQLRTIYAQVWVDRAQWFHIRVSESCELALEERRRFAELAARRTGALKGACEVRRPATIAGRFRQIKGNTTLSSSFDPIFETLDRPIHVKELRDAASGDGSPQLFDPRNIRVRTAWEIRWQVRRVRGCTVVAPGKLAIIIEAVVIVIERKCIIKGTCPSLVICLRYVKHIPVVLTSGVCHINYPAACAHTVAFEINTVNIKSRWHDLKRI